MKSGWVFLIRPSFVTIGLKHFLNVPRLVAEAFSLVRCPDNAVVFVHNHWESWVWHHKWIRRSTTTSRVCWPDQIIGVCVSKRETSILLKPKFQFVPCACVRCPNCFWTSIIVSVEDKVSIILKYELEFLDIFFIVVSFCESELLLELNSVKFTGF